ncbi:unnamed protein product [Heligmosomoides polygyrus]|uniref:7TM_GPCR_Srx domain-containing protein n=1 Tax=Heligmosomoides polygyrus TaxID=6339 RepID=A0A183GC59_HELPZ|nr:unnamed protein product [Heligmosomoides polygyrus]
MNPSRISLTGSLANWIVATTTVRLPSLRNSFGRLLASQSSAEAVYCSIFAFFYSPMVFFDVVAMKLFSHRLGIVILMCYDICIYSHLFISVNRLFAICFPFRYERYFSCTLWRVSFLFITDRFSNHKTMKKIFNIMMYKRSTPVIDRHRVHETEALVTMRTAYKTYRLLCLLLPTACLPLHVHQFISQIPTFFLFFHHFQLFVFVNFKLLCFEVLQYAGHPFGQLHFSTRRFLV